MKLISKDGSYLRNSFVSKGIKWSIIGSQSNSTLLETIDTFVSEAGAYQSATRLQLIKLQEQKHIKAID